MGNNPIRDEQIAQLILQEINLIMGAAGNWRLSLLKAVAVLPTRGGARYTVLYAPAEGWADEVESGNPVVDAQALFNRSRGYLRRELAESLNLRRMPELDFAPAPDGWLRD